jgi:hypothetical protein
MNEEILKEFDKIPHGQAMSGIGDYIGYQNVREWLERSLTAKDLEHKKVLKSLKEEYREKLNKFSVGQST